MLNLYQNHKLFKDLSHQKKVKQELEEEFDSWTLLVIKTFGLSLDFMLQGQYTLILYINYFGFISLEL